MPARRIKVSSRTNSVRVNETVRCAALQLVGAWMEPQIPERQFRRLRRGSAPGNGSEPRQKDIQFEGLGEIVVRAAIQSLHDIGPGIARGNDDHRRVKTSLPQPPQDAQAVHAGKHDVEQNDVDIGRQSELQSPVSVIRKQRRSGPRSRAPGGADRRYSAYLLQPVCGCHDLDFRKLISDDDSLKFTALGRFLRLSSDSPALMLRSPTPRKENRRTLCARSKFLQWRQYALWP